MNPIDAELDRRSKAGLYTDTCPHCGGYVQVRPVEGSSIRIRLDPWPAVGGPWGITADLKAQITYARPDGYDEHCCREMEER